MIWRVKDELWHLDSHRYEEQRYEVSQWLRKLQIQMLLPMGTKSWCVEWFGSEGDFLAGGKREPIPLARLSGLENLYAIGSLEQRPGEVSIFDSVPFISEVWHPTEPIDNNRVYRAEFLFMRS